jgi:hypothetical protein
MRARTHDDSNTAPAEPVVPLMGYHSGSFGFGAWLVMSLLMLGLVGLLAGMCMFAWRTSPRATLTGRGRHHRNATHSTDASLEEQS